MNVKRKIMILITTMIVLSSYTTTIAATSKTPVTPNIVTQQKKLLTVKEIAKKNIAVVYIEVNQKNSKNISQGSGFLVSNDGKIVTNYHVIDNAEKITVKLSNGNKYTINSIIGYDKDKDIAILQIAKVAKAPYVSLGDSDLVELGEDIVAVGSPLGLQNTVSTGIISSIRNNIVRDADGCLDFQISAPISHGSSGGALFNMYGEVIGITYAGLASLGGENLNFAIPINDVKLYIDSDISLTIKQFYEKEHTIRYTDGAVYEGDLLDGLPHGYGTETFANGNVYIGQWDKGRFHGLGTLKWAVGDEYIGDFVNGMRSGKGTYKWLNSDMYVGVFFNNKMNGQGTYYFSNGATYEGGWLNDLKNGQGKFTDYDGSIIFGTWVNDIITGTSKVYFKDGSMHYITWVDGKAYMIDGRVVK